MTAKVVGTIQPGGKIGRVVNDGKGLRFTITRPTERDTPPRPTPTSPADEAAQG